jgi:hypothetical protein
VYLFGLPIGEFDCYYILNDTSAVHKAYFFLRISVNISVQSSQKIKSELGVLVYTVILAT